MPADPNGGAVYTVNWQATGFDEVSAKLRQFVSLKKEADQAAAKDIQVSVSYGSGASPGGSGAAGGVRSRRSGGSAGDDGLSDADQRLMQGILGEAASRRQNVDQDAQIRQQKERLAAQDRQIAQRQTDLANRQQQTQQRELDKDVQHKITLRQQEEGMGAGRIASAIGWLPGVPQTAYFGQMALESLGLPGLAVLGGTLGLAGMGIGTAAYFATSNALASQNLAAQHFSAMAGGSGAAPRPIDQAMAAQMTLAGQSFSLTREQTMEAMGAGLAGLNLANPTRMVQATQLGLAAAQNAGLTPDQGIQLAGTLMARLGLTADQTSTALQRIVQAADAANTSVTQFGQDLLSLGGYLQPGTNIAQLGMLEGVAGQYGLNLQQLMGGSLTATGMGRIQQAALLGVSPDQMATLQQQNPAELFRLQQQAFMRFEGQAPAGSQRSVAEAVFGQAGLLPSGVSADTFARAMETPLTDQQIAAFQARYGQAAGATQTPGQYIQQAQSASIVAATADIRVGVLKQQAATTLAGDLTSPVGLGTIAAGAGLGAAAGAAFLGVGALPGAIIGGLGGLGLDLATFFRQVSQQQQAAGPGGPAGQLAGGGGGGGGGQRLDVYLYNGETGQQIGRTTIPQGQSTATARVTPGPGLPANVQRVAPGTPTQTSLSGR